VPLHHHTVECTARAVHQPSARHSKVSVSTFNCPFQGLVPQQRRSPTCDDGDFHWSNPIQSSSGSSSQLPSRHQPHPYPHHTTRKSVATSPIAEAVGDRRSLPKGAHVRFSEGGEAAAAATASAAATAVAVTVRQEGAAAVTATTGVTASTTTTTIECRSIMEPTLRRGEQQSKPHTHNNGQQQLYPPFKALPI